MLSLDQLRAALGEPAGAIVVTHLYGQMASMHEVMASRTRRAFR